MMTESQAPRSEEWYIVRQDVGTCEIVTVCGESPAGDRTEGVWGPFESRAEAIAKRVGLIRAGRCQPR